MLPVTAEPVFRNLKFDRPTTLPSVEARRERFEDIFAHLAAAGVPRHDLVLAFDFVVRSHQQLTERLQFMRDDAYAYVDSIAPTDSSGVALTGVNFLGDCSDPEQRIWRHVSGTFEFPYYLTGDIDTFTSVTFLNEGADRMPVRNGTHPFPFDIAVPCSVKRGEEVGQPVGVRPRHLRSWRRHGERVRGRWSHQRRFDALRRLRDRLARSFWWLDGGRTSSS